MADNTSAASGLRLVQSIRGDMHKEKSFSSPYTAEMLSQIPTPILRFLIVLGPTIRRFRQCVEIVTWSTPHPRQSILAVLLWIICCLWTPVILTVVVPGLVLTKIASDWLRVQTIRRRLAAERATQQKKLKKSKNHSDDDSKNKRNEVNQSAYQEQDRHWQNKQEELVLRQFRKGRVSLDDTLQDLATIDEKMDRIRRGFQWLAENTNGSSPEVVVSILSIALYTWPTWIVLNWIMGPSGVLAFVGTLALTCQSPWFQVAFAALSQNVMLVHIGATAWAYGVAFVVSTADVIFSLGHPTNKINDATPKSKYKVVKEWVSKVIRRAHENKQELLATQDDTVDAKKSTRKEMMFQFQVYENQRWWLGSDWTTNMMPNEREPWTDAELAPIPSKEKFQLPPQSQTTSFSKRGQETVKQITTKTWSWVDSDWWVDMTGELQGRVDLNGWEYGDNAWRQMTGKPGINTFTRRRRWCRRARLVERTPSDKI